MFVPVDEPPPLEPTEQQEEQEEEEEVRERYAPEETKLDKYRKLMYAPTSRDNLLYMLDGRTNVYTYDELKDINSLEQLLSPYGSAILLYPNSNSDMGHWTCIFNMPGTGRIEFFDSYGGYIDDMIGEYNEDMKVLRRPKRIEPKLLELMIASPYEDFHYNEVPYQSDKIASNCCGLWTVMRLKNNMLTDDQFRKEFYDLPTSLNLLPDLFVSQLIYKLYPELYPSIIEHANKIAE